MKKTAAACWIDFPADWAASQRVILGMSDEQQALYNLVKGGA